MQDKPAESKALPHTVVLIMSGAQQMEAWFDGVFPSLHERPMVERTWPADPPEQIDAFLDDMDALGFAIWRTPSVVYVFAGE